MLSFAVNFCFKNLFVHVSRSEMPVFLKLCDWFKSIKGKRNVLDIFSGNFVLVFEKLQEILVLINNHMEIVM